MKNFSLLLSIFGLFLLTACAETQFGAHVAKQVTKDTRTQGAYKVGNPYLIDGQQYYPQETFNYSETGIASWYGPGFHAKQTANGETFNTDELTAAHRTLQMPSLVRVTNLENGRSIVLRVNDRGPFARGRIIDVSSKAADLLAMKGKGTAKVRVDLLPEESKRIAEDARLGMDTRGYEVALNSQGRLEVTPPTPGAAPASETVQSVRVASVESQALPPVQGHVSNDGRFLPDPVVTYRPVPTSSNIYVQAGSFGDPGNANRLSSSLTSVGNAKVYPADVGGKPFYRVRLGPYAQVEDADIALAKVIAQGTANARIIVD